MKKISVLLILWFSFIANAQQRLPDTTIIKIRNQLYSYNTKKALKTIDSLLLKDIALTQRLGIESFKVSGLVQAELYDEALHLANNLLEEPELSPLLKIKIKLQSALLLEIVDDYDLSKEKLDDVENYYNTQGVVKDSLFGEYLYRLASWHRQKGDVETGRIYAAEAYNFGKKNNHRDVVANAAMLLGFTVNAKDLDAKEAYYAEALKEWKSVKDDHGTSGMYVALARVAQNKGYLNKALKYADSALAISKKSGERSMEGYANYRKSKIYEAQGDFREALHFYKKFKISEDSTALIKQTLAVNEMKFNATVTEASFNNKMLQETLHAKNTQNRMLLAATTILILSFLLIVFLFLRKRQDQHFIKNQASVIQHTNIALEKILDEKEFLLKESFHRVKNNLALIVGLVSFQKRNQTNSVFKESLNDLQYRIKAIAIAHENFVPSANAATKKSNLDEYLSTIINALISVSARPVLVNKKKSNIFSTLDISLPIGILVNELVSNTIKHAIVDEEVSISLEIEKKDGFFHMKYTDNGLHFKENESTNSLGLSIIKSMVMQLSGTFTRDFSKYEFSFPDSETLNDTK